jgi:adenylyl-sulfate kinase
VIDGDAVRDKDGRRLGFSREDIRENNRRIAELALEESKTHDVVLVPVISPYQEDRAQNRAIIGRGYIEVFLDCPLSVCEERDVKGLYKKARTGEVANFIGVSDTNPYEKPSNPDIVIDTSKATVEEEVEILINYIHKRI